jgi:hypothetical protein
MESEALKALILGIITIELRDEITIGRQVLIADKIVEALTKVEKLDKLDVSGSVCEHTDVTGAGTSLMRCTNPNCNALIEWK